MDTTPLYVSLGSSLLSGVVGAGLGAYVSTRALRRTDNRAARRDLVSKLSGQIPELSGSINWVYEMALVNGAAQERGIESLEIVDRWISTFEESRVQAVAYCRRRFVRAFGKLATLLIDYREPLVDNKDGVWQGYLISPETTRHVSTLYPKLSAALDEFHEALVREARRY